jgi:hypothetical protein
MPNTDAVTTLDDNMVLTTKDNPYNPKTDYDKWKEWDEDNGYNTESYVARLIAMEGEFDVDDDLTINNLIDKVYHEILENDVLNVYILI